METRAGGKRPSEGRVSFLKGNCARIEGGWHVHVHATLGDKGFAAQSGHLGAGTVKVTVEVFLLRVPFAIHRKKEEATGIMGMTFE
ncbi:MAG: hypothetical protein HY897_21540 [Deltaproteobacteria bacterium]|nr:hypothetical protein [Deltaproteobacteria bacterium]